IRDFHVTGVQTCALPILGFDRGRNTFVQQYGGDALDASLLLVAETGFVEPDDPRFAGTVAAVERDLLRDGFVRRYRTERVDDGLDRKSTRLNSSHVKTSY